MPVFLLAGKSTELFRSKALTLDEFVPIVKIDRTAFKSDKIAHIFENKDAVKLSDKVDEDKRKIELVSIVTSPGILTIPFKVEKGKSTLDRDGYLTPKVDAKINGVNITPNSPSEARFGRKYEVTLDISGNNKKQFFVDFFANDDADDINQGELRDVFCGRIEIQIYPDVFTEYECNRLIDEINFIQPFADDGSPSEYAGNYCMSAAERGLSKLLNNTTDFYSVDRSHKRLNAISFSGKGAKERGIKFKSLGFVNSSFTFDGYQINHNVRIKTKNDIDYTTNMYKAVTLRSGSKLQEYCKNSIKGKNGFHVYYMSISDDFHTLLLVIDNRDSKNETYAIYDQHGKTSSFGRLSDIEAGFAKQTSWTFLNFYANQGYKPNVYGGVITRIWKIQRKLQ